MAEKQTLTPWAAFEKAGLFPVEVTCDGYLPVHTRNNGCHTRIAIRRRDETGKIVDTADGIINHVQQPHGNREFGTGFLMKFRRTENKTWGGWKQLAEAKIEVTDLRCDHCGAEVPVRPQELLAHMKPHSGKFKKSVVKQLFVMSLREDKPFQAEDEDLFADVD